MSQRSVNGIPGESFQKAHYRLRIVLLCAAALFPAMHARAQGLAAVSGVVTDTSGVPVIGANVSIAGTSLLTTTDEDGRFRLAGIMSGAAQLRARRLGFGPLAHEITLAPDASIDGIQLRMSALPNTLKPVVVRSDRVEFRGRLAGYYQRMQRRATGHFISRDQIDRYNYRSLSQLLKNVPGIDAFSLRSGGAAVRMRGRSCRPLVWVDGVPMPAGEVDLDAFPVSSLHGIELYLGSTTAPLSYTANNGMSSCGTILLWSRGPDTDPPARRRIQSVDLEALVQSLSVFPADQVDKPAEPLDRSDLEIAYPPELLLEGVAGSVLAEFVVDTTGRIEMGTVAIVSSSNPLFSAAVRRALQSASYTPAMKNGAAVRQVVQQPFNFNPDRRKSAQLLH